MVFLNPDYVIALYQVNTIKDRLTDKFVEKEYLKIFVVDEIKNEYMLRVGSLEYKKMLLENNIKKAKRKLELQADSIEKNKIEELIKQEFKENTEKEIAMFNDIDNAINSSQKEPMTDKEVDELNFSFSILVRTWNPILNPDLSDQTKSLYAKAKKVYKEGNEKLLDRYVDLIDDKDIVQQGEIDELMQEYERYQKLLKDTEEEIKTIKNTFPFTELSMLENENLVRRKKDELNEEIAKLQEEYKKLQNKI